jgi:hypothetical protein
MTTVTLWHRDSLRVTVAGGVDGLTFHAQDLDPPALFGDEYEYSFSIAATEIPKLVRALGGSEPSEVLELLQASAEQIIPKGIESWMKAHDIPVTDFWSWF